LIVLKIVTSAATGQEVTGSVERRNPQMLPLLPEESDVSCADNPAEADTHLLAALEETLAELSPDERTLIEASYFEGASHQSIADTNATTANPAKIRFRLARW